ncbi:MAG TPA: PASTA domain-containing protein [Micromonosporaceae bacterium]|jgi:serine/threonine-protein kinase
MDTMGGHLRGRDDVTAADALRGVLISGRYRVVGRLARGGTTTVYQARDERLDRSVAIRIINPEHVLDAAVLDRLAAEAQTVAHLSHPNIVAVFDQGSYEGAPFVVTEYVHGRSLREVVRDRGRLDPTESLAVIEQVLAALAVAHRDGLVHRAVKPENILVAPPPNGSGDLIDAVVKVADFGLARSADIGRSQTSPLLGPAAYLAPELITDGRADTRADVYSVGIVLFEMLTGRIPFTPHSETAEQVQRYPGGLDTEPAAVTAAWRHVDEEVPPPSRFAEGVPDRLDDIVVRATRRDPQARPRDADALLAQIQATREEMGALGGPTRAIAHPTVAVPSLSGRPPRSGGSRLPEQRASGRAAAAVGARVRGADEPASMGERVGSGIAAAVGWLRLTANRLRYTAKGRRILTIVIVVLGLLLITGGWWLGAGRYTKAPNLLNFSKDNAIAEAQRQGFGVTFGAPIYSEVVPADTVLNQQPAPGGRIVRGGTVIVYLSLGPERYAVPDITGQELEYALTRIPKQLLVDQVDGYSDTLPKGYVAGTKPVAGEILAPGQTVTVTVVKGPFPVHVPEVVTKLLGDAENDLHAAGFTDIVVQNRDSDQPKDTVLEQTPDGNTGLASASGQTVTLVVSNGPALPMPNFVGLTTCQIAVGQLQAMGMIVATAPLPPEQLPGDWTVTAQSPGAGQALTPGQTIDLTCAPPPPPVTP